MKTIYVLILLLLVSRTSDLLAQESDPKVYSWEEARVSDPDTIYGISFAKMKLSSLPEELAKFQKLKVLDLQKNKLTKLPDFIGDMKQLTRLDVAKNKLSVFPMVVCRMSSLEQLILNRNLFEKIPECIEYASSLKYIDLYDTPIRDLPGTLVNLKNLEKIDFSGIRFAPSFQEKWNSLLPEVDLVFDEGCDCME